MDRCKLLSSKQCCIWVLLAVLSLVLVGCVRSNGYAPLVSLSKPAVRQHKPALKRTWSKPKYHRRTAYYRVRRGDTVYSIAWSHGLDYRELAAANKLSSDYAIKPGQLLRLTAIASKKPSGIREKRARSWQDRSKRTRFSFRSRKASYAPVRHWSWPARGRVAQGFTSGMAGNKGINISGRYGESVRASASGVVVYSGDGVRGYGNLIILKHNNNYLSAYAFNKRLLVHLGQWVKADQPIALMGRNNAGKVLLHFEIRRNGRPINPMVYLRKRA